MLRVFEAPGEAVSAAMPGLASFQARLGLLRRGRGAGGGRSIPSIHRQLSELGRWTSPFCAALFRKAPQPARLLSCTFPVEAQTNSGGPYFGVPCGEGLSSCCTGSCLSGLLQSRWECVPASETLVESLECAMQRGLGPSKTRAGVTGEELARPTASHSTKCRDCQWNPPRAIVSPSLKWSAPGKFSLVW